jgi:Tol biopolymer transport system component
MELWEMYISRDGQSAVYINSSDDSVWRSRADGSAPQKLVQSTNALRFTHVRFSPDGNRILLQSGGRGRPSSIYTMSADGGALTELVSIGHPWIMPDLSPDSQSIVFGADSETANKTPERSLLSVYHLKSEETTAIPDSQGLFGAVWSPDGRYLAAFSIDRKVMRIYDFARHRWRDLARGNYLSNPYWSADGKYIYFQDLLTSGEPVLRFPTATWRSEVVFNFDEILRSGPQRCLFIGLTPDGSLITRFTRDGNDVYALDVDLP